MRKISDIFFTDVRDILYVKFKFIDQFLKFSFRILSCAYIHIKEF